MNFLTRWQATNRRQRIALVVLLVWLLYALLGYFLLSPWLRSTIIQNVSELTGREVVLEKVVFNPLVLSLSVQNFALRDTDGTDLFAFDEFYANFQLSSLFRWSIHFDRISLYAPRGRVVKTGADSFNFDDIVARLAQEQSEQDEAAATALPRLSFRELLLVSGDFRFRDEHRAEPAELVLAPVTFQVNNFSTRADGEGNNRFEFVAAGPSGGELDWAGSISFDPLDVAGRLSLSEVDLTPFTQFFQQQFQFRVPSAMLDITSDYHFKSDSSGQLSLSQGSVALTNLKITDPDLEQPVISLPLLKLVGISIDSQTQQVGIEELLLDGLQMDLRLRNDGLHLKTLFEPLPEPAESLAQDEEKPSAPWQLLLAKLEVREASIRVLDETLSEPAELIVAPVNFVVEQLAFNRDEVFSIDGNLLIADSGKLQLTGKGTLEPLAVELHAQLSDLALGALQPWWQDSAAVSLTTGVADANLVVSHTAAGHTAENDAIAADNTLISGSLQVRDLAVQERSGEPLLAFSGFDLQGLNVSLLQQSIGVESVTLTDMHLQSLVDANGDAVSVRIANASQKKVAGTTPSSTESTAPWHIKVDAVQLRNGAVVHIDRSLSPSFRVALDRLDGDLRGLDSASKKPAQLNLSGRIDQVTPLTVRGTLSPLADKTAMDLTLQVSSYDMSSLTPFTGQILGYAVASGQLVVDSRIALDGSLLDSDTRIQASNFFLGDSIDSDGAINAPIKLGLAVLRDRNGMIDLPVRANGDLNDPSVSVSGIIVRALTNVMIKAAISPFSALAALAGGDELDYIDFTEGTDLPSAEGQQQMATLANLLTERPTLLMNLSGSVQPEDRLPLAQAELGQLLLEAPWTGLDAALESKGFLSKVEQRYRDQFDQRAEALLGDSTIEDRTLRDRTIAERAFMALAQQQAQTLPQSRLLELAAARAQHSKALLVEQFAVDAERLFIIEPTINGEKSRSGVVLGLGVR